MSGEVKNIKEIPHFNPLNRGLKFGMTIGYGLGDRNLRRLCRRKFLSLPNSPKSLVIPIRQPAERNL